MKCPFQTITTERTVPGDGALKETKVVFGDCLEEECPFYKTFYCVGTQEIVGTCRRTK